jgi:acyl carrier protein
LWDGKEFEIEIPDRDAQNILTVDQFPTYVHHKLLDIHGSNATSVAEIFERIKKFLVSEVKIAPEKISRSSYFAKELRLDQ